MFGKITMPEAFKAERERKGWNCV